MSIKKSPISLEIKDFGPKGRGVCVLQNVESGTILESLPVFVIDKHAYQKTRKLPYINHTFVWDLDIPTGAIGFGFASLCNHSNQPNAYIKKNLNTSSIDLVALQNLIEGEEITIRYNNTPFQIH